MEYTIIGVHGDQQATPLSMGSMQALPSPSSIMFLLLVSFVGIALKTFAHDDYKNCENIKFSELPLRMEGDSDDDGTDSEAEWPSLALDLVESREEQFRGA